MRFKPNITLEAGRPISRTCYGCGAEADKAIHIGHTSFDGIDGNSQVCSLCYSCRDLLRVALLSEMPSVCGWEMPEPLPARPGRAACVADHHGECLTADEARCFGAALITSAITIEG